MADNVHSGQTLQELHMPFMINSGSPEGSLTGEVDDYCYDYTNSIFYRKDTGVSNTGWEIWKLRQLLGDLSLYDPATDASPELRIGAVDAEELHIEAFFKSGTATLEKVQFTTDTVLADADAGQYKFNVGGVDIFAIDDNGIEIYLTTNNADPTINLGSSSAETFTIKTVFASSSKLVDYVEFKTTEASATADRGEFRFSVDGSLILTIDDGGLELLDGALIGVTSTVDAITIEADGDIVLKSDLYLATGNKIDFDSGDITFTHSSNTMTIAGATTWDMGSVATLDFDGAFSITSNNGLQTYDGGSGGVRLDDFIGINSAPTINNTIFANRSYTATEHSKGIYLFETVILANGKNFNPLHIRPSVITTTGSTTIADIGSKFNSFTVTDGGGTPTITILSNIYIEGAPSYTGPVTNGPYAFFVDDDVSRFDGDIGESGNRVPEIFVTDIDVANDLWVADGSVLGIEGNEIITFNAAGTIVVSGAILQVDDIQDIGNDATLSFSGTNGVDVVNAFTAGTIASDTDLTAGGDLTVNGAMKYGSATSLTISAGGAVAVTTSYHTIVVNGGTNGGNDDLTTATGGAEGDLLILKPATSGGSDTVTVKDGTGANTFILAGTDFAMNHIDDRLICIHNGTEWVELSRSENS